MSKARAWNATFFLDEDDKLSEEMVIYQWNNYINKWNLSGAIALVWTHTHNIQNKTKFIFIFMQNGKMQFI